MTTPLSVVETRFNSDRMDLVEADRVFTAPETGRYSWSSANGFQFLGPLKACGESLEPAPFHRRALARTRRALRRWYRAVTGLRVVHKSRICTCDDGCE